MRNRCTAHVEDNGEDRGNALVPILIAALLNGADKIQAGCIDDSVDAAEALHGRGNKGVAVRP
ncbi:hypothetical protein D3C71_1487210 [compost metagenome]